MVASPLDARRPAAPGAACLDAELATRPRCSPSSAPTSRTCSRAVADLLRGGKRLRAAFLYWGYRAAGRPDSDALVRAGHRDGVLPGRRADPRRRHGRLRHPPRDAGRAPRARRPARDAGLGAATPTGSAWPAPSSPATSASTGPTELYATCGLPADHLARGRAGLRPDAHPADGRPVPRRRRVGAALGRPARRRSASSGPSG